jgi:hypothetical protein
VTDTLKLVAWGPVNEEEFAQEIERVGYQMGRACAKLAKVLEGGDEEKIRRASRRVDELSYELSQIDRERNAYRKGAERR